MLFCFGVSGAAVFIALLLMLIALHGFDAFGLSALAFALFGVFTFFAAAGVGIGRTKWAPAVLALLSMAVFGSVIALDYEGSAFQGGPGYLFVIAGVGTVLALNWLAMKKLYKGAGA